MDYRKNMNTPRDMVEDEMLLRLMREAEPCAAMFGGNTRRENRRRNNTGNCGCRTAERREERNENRSGNRCGCGCEQKEYVSERRERDTEKDCGCDRDRRAQEWNDGEYEVRNPSCDSCISDEHMKHFRLAMAYVPWQEWEKIHEDETALARGTLFEDLDLPWGQSACDRGNGVCGKCSDNR